MAPRVECINPCCPSRKVPTPRLRRSASISSIRDHHPPWTAPSSAAITDLPLELIYNIFDILDPIDCTCLGLANHRFYAVLRHLYGSVPLSCQRLGPNDLEWAWNWAQTSESQCSCSTQRQGSVQSRESSPLPSESRSTAVEPNKGQGFCRHCGANRCQLHRHLYCWMGVNDHRSEYCSVAERFLPPADQSPVKHCYLTKPGWPRRCGKHPSSDIISTPGHHTVKV